MTLKEDIRQWRVGIQYSLSKSGPVKIHFTQINAIRLLEKWCRSLHHGIEGLFDKLNG